MKYLPLPDGSYLKVADETTLEEAQRQAVRKYPELFTEQAEKEAKGGIFENLSAGFGGALGDIGTTTKRVTGQDVRGDLNERMVEGAKTKTTGLSDVKEAFGKGIVSGLGSTYDLVTENVAQSLGQMGPAMLAARGMALIPGVGWVGSGLASLGVLAAQHYGSNLGRQQQEARSQGKDAEFDDKRAAVAAAAQAALDAVGLVGTLGTQVTRRIMGFSAEELAKKSAKELAENAVKEAAVKHPLLRGLGKGVLFEAPTEGTQQAFERWQSGLDLTSPEARSEIGEAAAIGGLVGGVLGPVAGRSEKRAAQNYLKQKDLAEQADARRKDREAVAWIDEGLRRNEGSQENVLAALQQFDALRAEHKQVSEELKSLDKKDPANTGTIEALKKRRGELGNDLKALGGWIESHNGRQLRAQLAQDEQAAAQAEADKELTPMEVLLKRSGERITPEAQTIDQSMADLYAEPAPAKEEGPKEPPLASLPRYNTNIAPGTESPITAQEALEVLLKHPADAQRVLSGEQPFPGVPANNRMAQNLNRKMLEKRMREKEAEIAAETTARRLAGDDTAQRAEYYENAEALDRIEKDVDEINAARPPLLTDDGAIAGEYAKRYGFTAGKPFSMGLDVEQARAAADKARAGIEKRLREQQRLKDKADPTATARIARVETEIQDLQYLLKQFTDIARSPQMQAASQYTSKVEALADEEAQAQAQREAQEKETAQRSSERAIEGVAQSITEPTELDLAALPGAENARTVKASTEQRRDIGRREDIQQRSDAIAYMLGSPIADEQSHANPYFPRDTRRFFDVLEGTADGTLLHSDGPKNVAQELRALRSEITKRAIEMAETYNKAAGLPRALTPEQRNAAIKLDAQLLQMINAAMTSGEVARRKFLPNVVTRSGKILGDKGVTAKERAAARAYPVARDVALAQAQKALQALRVNRTQSEAEPAALAAPQRETPQNLRKGPWALQQPTEAGLAAQPEADILDLIRESRVAPTNTLPPSISKMLEVTQRMVQEGKATPELEGTVRSILSKARVGQDVRMDAPDLARALFMANKGTSTRPVEEQVRSIINPQKGETGNLFAPPPAKERSGTMKHQQKLASKRQAKAFATIKERVMAYAEMVVKDVRKFTRKNLRSAKLGAALAQLHSAAVQLERTPQSMGKVLAAFDEVSTELAAEPYFDSIKGSIRAGVEFVEPLRAKLADEIRTKYEQTPVAQRDAAAAQEQERILSLIAKQGADRRAAEAVETGDRAKVSPVKEEPVVPGKRVTTEVRESIVDREPTEAEVMSPPIEDEKGKKFLKTQRKKVRVEKSNTIDSIADISDVLDAELAARNERNKTPSQRAAEKREAEREAASERKGKISVAESLTAAKELLAYYTTPVKDRPKSRMALSRLSSMRTKLPNIAFRGRGVTEADIISQLQEQAYPERLAYGSAPVPGENQPGLLKRLAAARDTARAAEETGDVKTTTFKRDAKGKRRPVVRTRPAETRVSQDARSGIDQVEAMFTPTPKNVRLVWEPTESEELVAAANEQGIPLDKVQGVTLPDGKVVVVGRNHESVADLEATIAHEDGHVKVNHYLGEAGFNKLAQRTTPLELVGLGKELGVEEEIKDTLKRNKDSKRAALGELLARIAERIPGETGSQRLKRFMKEYYGAVRNWLRENKYVNLAKLNDADLYYTLKKARDYAGPAAEGAFSAEPEFRSKTTTPADIVAISDEQTSHLPGWWDRFLENSIGAAGRLQFIDRWDPLAKLVKIAKDIDPNAATMALYAARVADRISNFVNAAASVGVPTLKVIDTEYGPMHMVTGERSTSAADVVKALGKEDPDTFGNYIRALRSKRVGMDVVYGKDNEEARQKRDALIEYGDSNPQMQEAKKLYIEYNKNLLDLLAATGFLSHEAVANMSPEDYAPLYRRDPNNADEILMTVGEQTFKMGNVRQQADLAALKGSGVPVMPFLESMVGNTRAIVDHALTNFASRNVAYLVHSMGLGESKKVRAERITADQAKGVFRPTVDGKPTIQYRVNGDIFELPLAFDNADRKIDPSGIRPEHLVRGMEGISTSVPGYLRLLNIPSRVLRYSVTRNPVYAVRQIMRDPIAASLVTGTNFNVLTDTVKNLKRALFGQSKTMTMLQESGAVGGLVYEGDNETMARLLKRLGQGEPGVWQTLLQRLDDLAVAADAATRISVYEDALAQGANEIEAWLTSIESMNFATHGVSPTARHLSMMVPFLGAQINGLDAIYKAWKGKMPDAERLQVKEKFYKRALMLSALSFMYALASDDEDYYKNARPEERYGYFFLPIPGFEEPMRIPIPFELGILFKAVPEAAANLLSSKDLDEDTRTAMQGLKGLLKNQVPNVMTPQALKPIIEHMANHSFFTGQPIESKGMESLMPQDRFTGRTSEVAKALSFQFNVLGGDVAVSPVQIEALMRGYTASIGPFIMAMVDAALDLGEGKGEKPTARASENKFLGSMFQRVDGGAIIDRAYEEVARINQQARSFKAIIDSNDEKRINALAEDSSDYDLGVTLQGPARTFSTQMSELRKMEVQIRNDSTMSGAEKREMLDEIRQAQMELARGMFAVSREARALVGKEARTGQ